MQKGMVCAMTYLQNQDNNSQNTAQRSHHIRRHYPRRSICPRLRGKRIRPRRSSAELTLLRNSLLIIPRRSNSPRSGRLGPGDDSAGGRRGDGARDVGQRGGAVLGQVVGLVEFV